MIVVLDTGPLGRISNPRASDLNLACHQWLQSLLGQDIPVFIPEIADYEVRRELLRARKLQGLARLDLLKETLEYLPLTTPIMLRAAELMGAGAPARLPYGRSPGAGRGCHPGGAGPDPARHRGNRKCGPPEPVHRRPPLARDYGHGILVIAAPAHLLSFFRPHR